MMEATWITRGLRSSPLSMKASDAIIVDGVDMHNISVTAMPEYTSVNFVLRGERGDVLGGVLGLLWGRWLQITHVWVSAVARGKGYGKGLLLDAEDYARARDAVGATL